MNRFPVANRAERRLVQLHAVDLHHLPNFIEQPVVEHVVDPTVDPVVQCVPIPIQHNSHVVERGLRLVFVVVRQGLPGAVVYFEGANHVLGLRRVGFCSLLRVDRLEFLVECFLTLVVESFVEAGPDFIVYVRNVSQAILQCVEVEGRASDNEWTVTAG